MASRRRGRSSNRHAWRRAYSRRDVQLCFVGAAGSCGSSAASGSEVDGRGAGDAEPGVRCALRSLRAAIRSRRSIFCGRLLLQVFYSVGSERLLVEQIDYNLLFRWFVGLGMDDAVWNHAVFSKNRDRLLSSDVAQRFFAEVNKQAKKFMSDEHFTVDGTLIQAWASQKKFSLQGGLRR